MNDIEIDSRPKYVYKERPCYIAKGFHHHHPRPMLLGSTSYLLRYIDGFLPETEFVSCAHFRRHARRHVPTTSQR